MKVLKSILAVLALLFFGVYAYSAWHLLFEQNDVTSQLVLISGGVALLFALLSVLRVNSYMTLALL